MLLTAPLEIRGTAQGRAGPQEEQVWVRRQQQEGRETQARAYTEVSEGKAEQGRVNRSGLAGLNSCDRLWGTGAVPSCLVLGPGAIQCGRNTGLMHELSKGVAEGYRLWIGQFVYERCAPSQSLCNL